MALIGDVTTIVVGGIFWYEFSYVAIGIGVLSALLAAVFGFIDYFGVRMSAAGARLATIHMVLNLLGVSLYAVSFILRRNDAAFQSNLWVPAFVLALMAFGTLGVSGWIGGKMSYLHKIGVVEDADREATELGMRRAA
jgi:uncharacterized membrane protein